MPSFSGGAGCYGRTTVPAWVPALDTIADVSLNKMTDSGVDPELDAIVNPNYPAAAPWHGTSAIAGAFFWSGCNYNADLGSLGSLIKTCSGHSAYAGNEIYRYDVATQTVSRVTDPHQPLFTDAVNAMYTDQPDGEMWTDATCTAAIEAQPGSFQSYDFSCILPSGVGGAGSSGALLTPIRPAMSPNGAKTGLRAHRYDFATPGWSRMTSTSPAQNAVGGSAVVAPSRSKLYMLGAPGTVTTSLCVLNLSTWAWSVVTLSEDVPAIQHMNLRYMADVDRLVLYYLDPSGGLAAFPKLSVIHPDTGVVSKPGTTGTAPAVLGGGEWVESVSAFYYFQGITGGENDKVYKLTRPSDYTGTAWTWSSVTIAGTAGLSAGDIPHESRFRHVDELTSASVFLWWPSAGAKVQAVRLSI